MVERGGRRELNKPTSFQSTNGTALNEDTITPLVSASLLLLLSNLKEYSSKACKWIVSFPQSDLLSFWKSLSQTLETLSVEKEPGLTYLGELWILRLQL